MPQVCTDIQNTDPLFTGPVELPPFSAPFNAQYNLEWTFTSLPGQELGVTLEYYYKYQGNGSEVTLHTVTAARTLNLNINDNTDVNFDGVVHGGQIFARVTFDGVGDVQACVEDGTPIVATCGSDGLVFKDDPYWHVQWERNQSGAFPSPVSASIPASTAGEFVIPFYFEFDQASPDPAEFTWTVEVIDTFAVSHPVDLTIQNTANVINPTKAVYPSGGTLQLIGTYNVASPDFFQITLNGVGPVEGGFRLDCREAPPIDDDEVCCEWFANSFEECYEFEVTDPKEVIGGSPVLPEYEYCKPLPCYCVPVFWNPEDLEDNYSNDFSSWLFESGEPLDFTIQKLTAGAWVDVGTPDDIRQRGSFANFPNRSGVIINWKEIAEAGTYRLKVGEDLFSLPHCLEPYNCRRETIRITGEWTQEYTNYRFKALEGEAQFIRFEGMEDPWPYQMRYYGTLNMEKPESTDREDVAYYDDFNKNVYEKMQEMYEIEIQKTIIDIYQRHVYYVSRGSEMRLDRYEAYSPQDSTGYFRDLPVIYDAVGEKIDGSWNPYIPSFKMMYRKRYDNMLRTS